MRRHFTLAVAATTSMLACSDPTTAPNTAPHSAAAARAPGGGGGTATRYKLRFVSGTNVLGDGEILSAWFPDSGIVMSSKTPWKSLSAPATLDLVNFTHGRWTAGTCATFTSSATINVTSWDIAGTNPVLSFAGRWRGTLNVSQTTGTSVGFDGDRVIDGIVTPSAGGIHNVVTNANTGYETQSGNGDWYQLEIRDAAMKFGSASSANGISNPTGAEVACASFTIVAMKSDLVTP